MNGFRFWTDDGLREQVWRARARKRNLQKLAESGYDVATSYEELEVDLLEMEQEAERRQLSLEP